MDEIIKIVGRSNQRGGRMLSVIDLLKTGTFSLEQVCRLLTEIEKGSSWLVGAKPGGAGKTTIMSALLAMLPAGEKVKLTVPGTGWEEAEVGECVVCYEISSGFYDAYCWGSDARKLTELGLNGRRIVSNLHADTLEQARRQVVDDCGAAEEGFAAFDLFLPITCKRWGFSGNRKVERIFQSRNGEWSEISFDSSSARMKMIGLFLRECLEKTIFNCLDVRKTWLEWRRANPL